MFHPRAFKTIFVACLLWLALASPSNLRADDFDVTVDVTSRNHPADFYMPLYDPLCIHLTATVDPPGSGFTSGPDYEWDLDTACYSATDTNPSDPASGGYCYSFVCQEDDHVTFRVKFSEAGHWNFVVACYVSGKSDLGEANCPVSATGKSGNLPAISASGDATIKRSTDGGSVYGAIGGGNSDLWVG